ncbi:MAG TPA: DUF6036 family nucleotidyltransferase [Phycisphaerales bacterium]|nr:DUF6036 family nucleotidyltransferase [Phycisphaerales bacterium]
MDLRLPEDFKEFLRLLNSEQVEYLLVGGFAVGHHGYPRPTGDLDIWIAISEQNANRLLSALTKFGFGGTGVGTDLFLKPRTVVRMGHPPVKIEIITSAAGVDFADCFARRQMAVIDGVSAAVISRNDLLINKRAAGRPKDVNDVQVLEGNNPA